MEWIWWVERDQTSCFGHHGDVLYMYCLHCCPCMCDRKACLVVWCNLQTASKLTGLAAG